MQLERRYEMNRHMLLCADMLRKMLRSILLLLVVLSATFAMLRAVPGGPFDGERELPPKAAAAISSYYGTDKSLWESYVHYLRSLIGGDLGPSFRQLGWSVRELIADKLLTSVELGAYGILFAVAVGVTSGSMAALYGRGIWRRIFWRISTIFVCLPSFASGPIGNYIFACKLHWLRATGWDQWRCKILPPITLGFFHGAIIARLTYKSMAKEFCRPYVRTALAKGLSRGAVFRKHIFRNGIAPVIAHLGPSCAAMLSGAFAVESIFHIPGLGRLFVESIGNRDYGIVTGIVLTYAALILLCNFIADIALVTINPQLRRHG
ncbi:MAG: ABC transporter permease [Puniceicoccales bacterium]|jgi:oligopeptide transport system permease protein|nr:ABC transporter permease [Puniceicoccales bacterium]